MRLFLLLLTIACAMCLMGSTCSSGDGSGDVVDEFDDSPICAWHDKKYLFTCDPRCKNVDECPSTHRCRPVMADEGGGACDPVVESAECEADKEGTLNCRCFDVEDGEPLCATAGLWPVQQVANECWCRAECEPSPCGTDGFCIEFMGETEGTGYGYCREEEPTEYEGEDCNEVGEMGEACGD